MSDALYKVVYLTGPPASGKSSLCRKLAEQIKSLNVFHYSKLLADHLANRAVIATEDELREASSRIVTPRDVEIVDDYLISTVSSMRLTSHCLIDSHAVTKESYGYRVTPFAMEKLRALKPTTICMLFAEAKEVRRRILAESGGRPMVSAFHADLHTQLQAQVGLAYSLDLGVPFYLFDTTDSSQAAFEKLFKLFSN